MQSAQMLPLRFEEAPPDADAQPRPRSQPPKEAVEAPAHLVGADPDFALHLLALGEIRGLGIHGLRALALAFGDLDRVWGAEAPAIIEMLTAAKVRGASHVAAALQVERKQLLDRAKRELDRLTRNGIRLIGAADPTFPERLRRMPGQPLWLFVHGALEALNGPPLVAVVGTRKATDQGLATTRLLTWLVCNEGMGIVSGLAEGIDGEAHAAAARVSAPQVAVLGTGIDSMFPATNRELRQTILDRGGAVVTEYMPKETYGRANFVQRNRIQAALASAVCPVEGQRQGGTAHTVRFARDYGRPLFGAYRGMVDPTNGLLDEVQTLTGDVFDLESDTGQDGLKRFLAEIPGPRGPRPPTPDLEGILRPMLARLKEYRAYYRPSMGDRIAIMQRIEVVLGLDDPEGPIVDGR